MKADVKYPYLAIFLRGLGFKHLQNVSCSTCKRMGRCRLSTILRDIGTFAALWDAFLFVYNIYVIASQAWLRQTFV